MTQLLTNPIAGGTIRGSDNHGAGHYGASRGSRRHAGIDIVASIGQNLLAPMPCEIVRRSNPYRDDQSYTGLLLRGTGAYADYEVKIFYCVASVAIPSRATSGSVIATVQDLTRKYPGITNHIHFQMKVGGQTVNPTNYIQGIR